MNRYTVNRSGEEVGFVFGPHEQRAQYLASASHWDDDGNYTNTESLFDSLDDAIDWVQGKGQPYFKLAARYAAIKAQYER